MTLLDHLQFWHWWILGLMLGVVEVMAPGAFFLWFGVAAGVTGLILLVLPGLDWHYQLLAFAVLAASAAFERLRPWHDSYKICAGRKI